MFVQRDVSIYFFLVWASSYPLQGRSTSRGRCWAAVRLHRHPEASGHAPHEVEQWTTSEEQLRTTWPTVCSAVPHPQSAEWATTYLYKQEQKLPTPVRRRLRRNHAVLVRAIPGRCVPMSGEKARNLVVFSNHYLLHRWSTQSAPLLLFS